MATKEFIVGGVDANWSTAGNWNPANKPVNGDTVTINAAVTSMVLDENTAVYISGFDMTGAGAGFTLSGSGTIYMNGHLTLKSGMTYSGTGSIIFYTNACNLDTNNVSLASITAGSGLTVRSGADLTIINNPIVLSTSKPFYVFGVGSSLTTNGQAITCGDFGDAANAGAITLTLGSSTINCTNVSFAAATLTVTANTATINVVPTATVTLNTSSTSWGAANFNVGAASKTVNLGAALTHTGTFTHVNGTFDLKGLTLTTGVYASSNTNTRVLQDSTGGANIIVTGVTGTIFDMATTTNLTVSNAPAVQIGTSALTQTGDVTFAGGGKTFGNFTITKHAGNYSCILTGSNTFATFTCATPDATYQYSGVKFTAGTTTTVTSFVATGTASYTIPITSVTGATHTLSDSAGTNTATYCTISYSVAQGGATWATSNCTDGGNNTGWTFGNRRRRLLICGGSR